MVVLRGQFDGQEAIDLGSTVEKLSRYAASSKGRIEAADKAEAQAKAEPETEAEAEDEDEEGARKIQDPQAGDKMTPRPPNLKPKYLNLVKKEEKYWFKDPELLKYLI